MSDDGWPLDEDGWPIISHRSQKEEPQKPAIASILELPDECLELIAEEINAPRYDLFVESDRGWVDDRLPNKNLRLLRFSQSCHRIRLLCIPIIFRKIVCNRPLHLRRLVQIAHHPHPQHIRQLKIHFIMGSDFEDFARLLFHLRTSDLPVSLPQTWTAIHNATCELLAATACLNMDDDEEAEEDQRDALIVWQQSKMRELYTIYATLGTDMFHNLVGELEVLDFHLDTNTQLLMHQILKLPCRNMWLSTNSPPYFTIYQIYSLTTLRLWYTSYSLSDHIYHVISDLLTMVRPQIKHLEFEHSWNSEPPSWRHSILPSKRDDVQVWPSLQTLHLHYEAGRNYHRSSVQNNKPLKLTERMDCPVLTVLRLNCDHFMDIVRGSEKIKILELYQVKFNSIDKWLGEQCVRPKLFIKLPPNARTMECMQRLFAAAVHLKDVVILAGTNDDEYIPDSMVRLFSHELERPLSTSLEHLSVFHSDGNTYKEWDYGFRVLRALFPSLVSWNGSSIQPSDFEYKLPPLKDPEELETPAEYNNINDWD